MDNTEIHYLTYDPDAVWKAMTDAYIDAGGNALYPGDEKEMLLRGVQAIITQTFAGVDAALRMSTLRYAVGDYLDLYGENRNCARIPAAAATAKIKITFAASGVTKTIAAGSLLTADGEKMYKTTEDIIQSGVAQEITTTIEAESAGASGNGLLENTQMQFMISNPAVTGVVVTDSASGGQDEEDDDTYRERIRQYGLVNTTTGSAKQYESVAMNASSNIVDANAVNLGGGIVGVYLILADTTGEAATIELVTNALSAEDTRPLTDTVTVAKAKEKSYTLIAQYVQPAGSNISEALSTAVSEYQEWQDNVIGQAFNPDKLMAMIYSAGATRVTWGDGSAFDGGTVQYTEVAADTRCVGTITLKAVES